MALSDIFSTARSGLDAAQAQLRAVSNNIANVSTPGYARETISLTARTTGGRSNGVIAGDPTRVADRFLEDSVNRRAGEAGSAEAAATYIDRLQASLGTPGSSSSLPGRIDKLSASAIAMSAVVDSPETVRAFIDNVGDAIAGLKQARSDTAALAGDVESETANTVTRINTLLAQIHDLNGTVTRTGGAGRSGAGLIDQRTAAIAELGGLVSIEARTQPDGRVAIDAADGTVLLDRRLRVLEAPVSSGGNLSTGYPPIQIRFGDGAEGVALLTGSTIEGGAVGGRLGGLLAVRDRGLPDFATKLDGLFTQLSTTLNSVSNAATAAPAPARLSGRPTGLTGSDALRFNGQLRIATTDSSGSVTASGTVDLSSIATVADIVTAINGAMGGAATASLDANGALSISAASGGVAVAQGSPAPDRAGVGFSQFFGLNDLVQVPGVPLVSSGLVAGDANGLGAGQSIGLALTDANGKQVVSQYLSGADGSTYGDLVASLNGGDLAQFGSFALDATGKLGFTPVSGSTVRLDVLSDNSNRFGSGVPLSALLGLPGKGDVLAAGRVTPAIAGDTRRLPLASLTDPATVGRIGIARGDNTVAKAYAAALGTASGPGSIERATADLVGGIGAAASSALATQSAAEARRDDAVARRDNFSGVNLDEELAQMVMLQNSYAASARVMSSATAMYDTLLSMVG